MEEEEVGSRRVAGLEMKLLRRKSPVPSGCRIHSRASHGRLARHEEDGYSLESSAAKEAPV